MSGRDPSLEFRVEALPRQGILHIRYAVRNDAARDVYLLNRLYRLSPPAFSADIAYVQLERAERLVLVSKKVAEVPPNMQPTSLVSPYVTPVRAGATFTETFRVPMPLRVTLEYGQSPPPQPPDRERITEYRGMRLAIEYFWRHEGMTETTAVRQDQEVTLPGGYRRPLDRGFLVSPVVPVPLPVIEPP